MFKKVLALILVTAMALFSVPFAVSAQTKDDILNVSISLDWKIKFDKYDGATKYYIDVYSASKEETVRKRLDTIEYDVEDEVDVGIATGSEIKEAFKNKINIDEITGESAVLYFVLLGFDSNTVLKATSEYIEVDINTETMEIVGPSEDIVITPVSIYNDWTIKFDPDPCADSYKLVMRKENDTDSNNYVIADVEAPTISEFDDGATFLIDADAVKAVGASLKGKLAITDSEKIGITLLGYDAFGRNISKSSEIIAKVDFEDLTIIDPALDEIKNVDIANDFAVKMDVYEDAASYEIEITVNGKTYKVTVEPNDDGLVNADDVKAAFLQATNGLSGDYDANFVINAYDAYGIKIAISDKVDVALNRTTNDVVLTNPALGTITNVSIANDFNVKMDIYQGAEYYDIEITIGDSTKKIAITPDANGLVSADQIRAAYRELTDGLSGDKKASFKINGYDKYGRKIAESATIKTEVNTDGTEDTLIDPALGTITNVSIANDFNVKMDIYQGAESYDIEITIGDSTKKTTITPDANGIVSADQIRAAYKELTDGLSGDKKASFKINGYDEYGRKIAESATTKTEVNTDGTEDTLINPALGTITNVSIANDFNVKMDKYQGADSYDIEITIGDSTKKTTITPDVNGIVSADQIRAAYKKLTDGLTGDKEASFKINGYDEYGRKIAESAIIKTTVNTDGSEDTLKKPALGTIENVSIANDFNVKMDKYQDATSYDIEITAGGQTVKTTVNPDANGFIDETQIRAAYKKVTDGLSGNQNVSFKINGYDTYGRKIAESATINTVVNTDGNTDTMIDPAAGDIGNVVINDDWTVKIDTPLTENTYEIEVFDGKGGSFKTTVTPDENGIISADQVKAAFKKVTDNLDGIQNIDFRINGYDQYGRHTASSKIITAVVDTDAMRVIKPGISIKNCKNITVDYRSTIILHAEYEIGDGGDLSVIWVDANGKKVGEGDTYQVKEAKASFTVKAQLVDGEGTVIAESASETVTVKTGFFAKLVALFRGWFGLLRKFENNVQVKK